MRILEDKIKVLTSQFEKEKFRSQEEIKQYKERLEVVKKMNLHL